MSQARPRLSPLSAPGGPQPTRIEHRRRQAAEPGSAPTLGSHELGRAPAEELTRRVEAAAATRHQSPEQVVVDAVEASCPPPFRSAEDVLGDRLATIAELGHHDLELVLSFIDALVTKTRLKTLAGGIN